ncbi:MAG TPA: A/G-specific adenine glycosylase [Alphaproteobacteria bacterium]
MRRPDSGAEEAAPVPVLAARLLDWYDRHRRRMPWRALPGERSDPYKIWLSEIMLQQTTVAAVGPYFLRFLERFPTVEALAAAEIDAILGLWQGLGYYARARNLHRAAQFVARKLGGRFPDSAAGLKQLPGIGDYTAAAIAAIAFDRREAAVDGNVERVMARLHAVDAPLPAAKPALRALAERLVPAARAGDFAQALMDLGATICTPRAPRCLLCPWADACRARARGIAEDLPRKMPKPARPVRHGVAFLLVDGEGAILLRRRPERGLLGGMMEVPSTEWRDKAPSARQAASAAPAPAAWRVLAGAVQHGFTHFELVLKVWAARVQRRPRVKGVWCLGEQLATQALPTVMKKILRHGLAQLGKKSGPPSSHRRGKRTA